MIFGILTLFAISGLIYFGVGFSSVYPPLEKYTFKMNLEEFKPKLFELNKHENLNIQMTDRNGQFPENYNQYFTIRQENRFEYRLKYSCEKSLLGNKHIEMSLLAVFENNIGGYRESDSIIIKKLISKFETDIVQIMKN